jgi:hypothetical protein
MLTRAVGGRIEVVSEHGKGSTFRFFIRVRTCQTQKRHATSDIEMTEANSRPPAKRRQTAAKSVKPSVLGPRPHVLIVEDNLINQTVLARQLKHVGLTCEGVCRFAHCAVLWRCTDQQWRAMVWKRSKRYAKCRV